MGADAAVGLESWREPERVVELARLAVARRAGVSEAEVAAVMRSLGAEGRATMLEMPQFGVSSSAVRERAAAGRPLRYLVPEPVARFIEEKGIYSMSAAASPRRWRGGWPSSPTRKRPRRSSCSTCASWSPTPTSWSICTARNERQAQAIVDEVRVQAEAGDGPAAGRRRGRRRGGLGRARLPRLRPPRLHRRGAGALPARGAVARGAAARARSRGAGSARSRERLSVAEAGTANTVRAPRTVPRMDSFKRALFGYRRTEVDAAISARDARIGVAAAEAPSAAQARDDRRAGARARPRSPGW